MIIAKVPFLSYVTTGKLKLTKHYLGGNLVINKSLNRHIYTEIRDICKLYIKSYINTEFIYNNNYKYRLEIDFIRKAEKYDIDNATIFWAKIFLDTIRPDIIPNDNVGVIPQLFAKHTTTKGDEYILFSLTAIED